MRNEVFRDTEWRVLAIFVAAPLAVRYEIINDFVKTTLKEYSSLQENPYNVRYIHTVLIVIIYFAPWGVDHV